jgi:integrase
VRNANGSATWTLPAERCKNGLPNELVLPEFAARLLPVQRVNADGTPRELLFGASTGPFSGWSVRKRKLDRKLANTGGELPPWTLHDLRRTFVTRLNDLGVEPHVIEALVNHSSGASKAGIAGVYNKSAYAQQKKTALDLWCKHVARLVGEDAGGQVVPLRRLASQ